LLVTDRRGLHFVGRIEPDRFILPHALFNRRADSLPGPRRRAKRNSQSLLPINYFYFCKVRM
jgi:hypothetical protein